MKVQTFEELFEDQVRDVYSAEQQLIKALPRMARAAKSPELRSAFETHLEQTKRHAERLERVCEELDIKPRGKKCVGMEGLVEEGKELLDGDVDPIVRDAGLIAAAQKVEHYEIAAYGTLVAHAEQINATSALDLLNQTLEEEKETDELLTRIAKSSVNISAASEMEEDEDEDRPSMSSKKRPASKRTR